MSQPRLFPSVIILVLFSFFLTHFFFLPVWLDKVPPASLPSCWNVTSPKSPAEISLWEMFKRLLASLEVRDAIFSGVGQQIIFQIARFGLIAKSWGIWECQGLLLKFLGLGVRSKHSGFVWSTQVRVPIFQKLGVKALVVSPLFFDPYHSVKVAEVQYYITSGSLLWLARWVASICILILKHLTSAGQMFEKLWTN